MYANQQIEQLDREKLQDLQLERLKKQIKWAQEKSLFYQRQFAEKGVSAAEPGGHCQTAVPGKEHAVSC